MFWDKKVYERSKAMLLPFQNMGIGCFCKGLRILEIALYSYQCRHLLYLQ